MKATGGVMKAALALALVLSTSAAAQPYRLMPEPTPPEFARLRAGRWRFCADGLCNSVRFFYQDEVDGTPVLYGESRQGITAAAFVVEDTLYVAVLNPLVCEEYVIPRLGRCRGRRVRVNYYTPNCRWRLDKSRATASRAECGA